MAKRTATRRTSAARVQVPHVEETQLSEEDLRSELDNLKDTLDEGSPIHVDDGNHEDDSGPSTAEPAHGTATDAPSDSSMSLAQKYTVWSVLTFGDCAVQKDAEGIFDVLGRNFDNNGLLSFWLTKIGYGHLTVYGKRRDIVDYLRKVAYELFKSIKSDIGKPAARW